jgi:RHS repeat-associated protein
MLVEAESNGTVRWMVKDALGSPRMLADQTGSLVGMKQRDFIPFGEEVFAPTGIRTTGMGYGISSDTTRQKFTGKERDVETGLDYSIARYYSAAQGRFTSVDPENAGASSDDPQSWNGYAYARSNPLLFTDPDGQQYLVCSSGDCGLISDQAFYDERRHFVALGFKFTGDGGFFENGSIIGKDGAIVATYEQISIDDRARELTFWMQVKNRDRSLIIISFTNAVLSSVIAGYGNRHPFQPRVSRYSRI